jgi:hypothetical protein
MPVGQIDHMLEEVKLYNKQVLVYAFHLAGKSSQFSAPKSAVLRGHCEAKVERHPS